MSNGTTYILVSVLSESKDITSGMLTFDWPQNDPLTEESANNFVESMSMDTRKKIYKVNRVLFYSVLLMERNNLLDQKEQNKLLKRLLKNSVNVTKKSKDVRCQKTKKI